MNKDTKDFLITAGSIFLAGWVINTLLKGGEYYKCPRCNYPVDNRPIHCPNCGEKLNWRGIK